MKDFNTALTEIFGETEMEELEETLGRVYGTGGNYLKTTLKNPTLNHANDNPTFEKWLDFEKGFKK
jgi:hypothetical protein